MTLNVVQLDPFALTPYYNAALCSALSEAGCRVRYASSSFLYDALPLDAQSYCIDTLYFQHLKRSSLINHPLRRRVFKLLSYSFGHRLFLRSLKDRRPDVVHIQWSRFPLLDHLLVGQIQALGVPVVHTVHDVEPLFSNAQTRKLAWIYALVDALVVHSTTNRDALLTRYPRLERSRIHVVPHILPVCVSTGMTRPMARAALNIPQNAPVVLFFGSIRPYKSLETLVDAYLLAQRRCPNLWIIVAGRPAYRGITRSLQKLGPQVVLRLEYIPMQQAEMYHRAADIAVFPYRRISQSGALITAMGYGLPVVVTGVGAMPETIDGNGWVVPPDDPEKLAEVLRVAMRDFARLGTMGERSLHLIQQRHAPALVAQQMLKVYQEVVS